MMWREVAATHLVRVHGAPLEGVAQQLLRSSSVRLAEMSVNVRPPTGSPQADAAGQREAWASDCHIDLQITTTDWNATPRRDLLAIWFWLDAVPAERAAMRILPGSHLPINEVRAASSPHHNVINRLISDDTARKPQHWERVLTPHQKLRIGTLRQLRNRSGVYLMLHWPI